MTEGLCDNCVVSNGPFGEATQEVTDGLSESLPKPPPMKVDLSPTLRKQTDSVDDVLRRAEDAKQARLKASQVSTPESVEFDDNVPSVLPPKSPTLAETKRRNPELSENNLDDDAVAPETAPTQEELPDVKNLAESGTVSEEEQQIEQDLEAEVDAAIEESADDPSPELEDKKSPADLVPSKIESIKNGPTNNDFQAPELSQSTRPDSESVVENSRTFENETESQPQSPTRTEEEVVRELQNTTVPHSIVYDSSPIIPEQRMKPDLHKAPNKTQPIADDPIVLRARPVNKNFIAKRKPIRTAEITPPPHLPLPDLRAVTVNEDRDEPEKIKNRESVTDPQSVVDKVRVPTLRASAVKKRFEIKDVVEIPQFRIEPLPKLTDVTLSPEGIPLSLISEEPRIVSLPAQSVVEEPKPVVEESIQTVPILKARIQEESKPNESALNEVEEDKVAPVAPIESKPEFSEPKPSMIRLQAAPIRDTEVFQKAKSSARIRTLSAPESKSSEDEPGQNEIILPLPPQPKGQPMFDYDKIKAEISRLSERQQNGQSVNR